MVKVRGQILAGIAVLSLISIGMITPSSFAVEGVDLVITSVQPLPTMEPIKNKNKKLSARVPIIEVAERGKFLKIETIIRNEGAAKSGPFTVRIYLSGNPEGRNTVHEFYTFKKVELSGSEQFLINEEYVVPYKDKDWVSPGRNYFVVVEVDYDQEVSEKGENKRKVIKRIHVPCDEIALGYGEEFHCKEHD